MDDCFTPICSQSVVMNRIQHFITHLAFAFRNFTSRKVFVALKKYCSGNVLDVGGAWFYRYVRKEGIPVTSWTSLDVDSNNLVRPIDDRHRLVLCDGCSMAFPDDSFDTIVNIQVLEHVLEPIRMVEEIHRVLKPNGYAIFLIPQTACVHSIPYCYSNFTIYWIREVLKKCNFTLVEEHKLGGVWSTMLFRIIYFFLQASRLGTFSSREYKRNFFFYLLLPFMMLYAVVSMPILLLFQFGDLTEEPNNHLVVAIKK